MVLLTLSLMSLRPQVSIAVWILVYRVSQTSCFFDGTICVGLMSSWTSHNESCRPEATASTGISFVSPVCNESFGWLSLVPLQTFIVIRSFLIVDGCFCSLFPCNGLES